MARLPPARSGAKTTALFVALGCLLLAVSLLFVGASAQQEEDKAAQLRKHTAKTADDELLQLSDKSFSRYVTTEGRTYGLVLLLSMPEHGASQMLGRALGQVKKAAQLLSSSPPLFFAELTSAKGKKSFTEIGVKQVPVLLYFPPQGHAGPLQYPIESMEHLTDPTLVARWLAQVSNVPVSIPQPLWKDSRVHYAAVALAGVAFFYKLPALIRNYDHHLIYFLGAMCVYAFTFSGTIYNAIHGVPWVGVDYQTGKLAMFMADMRSQYGVEGLIIVALNVVPAILLILLTAWVPYVKRGWLRLPLFALCFGGVTLCWLTQVRLFYHHKAPYYPFKV